jgi:peptidoglycan/LPS O-acetylase OafA/YrhL
VQYRREIDGLRAVAVVSVILFHAGFHVLSGGFVGVDIFFVISGYLITTIIVQETAAGSFSLAGFYERRARRIVPALSLVLLSTSIAAWMWLTPEDLREFGRSLMAVATFSSNVLFWRETGYFTSAAELKPLLHTWSLGVEEQYYLLFPVLLLALRRAKRNVVSWCLALVAVLSLALAHWGATAKPAAAFYLLPTRVWELLIGSFVALHLHQRLATTAPTVARCGSGLGLVLIVGSVLLLDDKTPFPSLYALAPTIGAALVILYASPRNEAGQLLGSKALVGIGLISYSAYLWHQPLFAFARHRTLELSDTSKLLLAAVCMGMAYATWKFVEVPFRRRELLSRSQAFWFAGIATLVTVSVGWVAHDEGLPHRTLNPHLPPMYLSQTSNEFGSIRGLDGAICVSESATICKAHHGSAGRELLLVGDSHSADFTGEFRTFLQSSDASGWQMSVGGCAFIPAHWSRNQGECGKARRLIEQAVVHTRFDTVVVVANLSSHVDNLSAEQRASNLDSFFDLLQYILNTGAKVVLVAPRPTFSVSPTKAAILNKLKSVKVVHYEAQDIIAKRLSAMNHRHFHVVDQARILVAADCGALECFNGHSREMVPLYRDSNHLTAAGAHIVFAGIARTLEPVAYHGTAPRKQAPPSHGVPLVFRAFGWDDQHLAPARRRDADTEHSRPAGPKKMRRADAQ